MSWIDLPDARIHYRLDGSANAPILVFSNSLGTNLTMWDAQIAELSQQFRILRYDTRGHGQSSVTQGPYSIELLGHDLIALLNALAIESFYFCGLSMGGMIGQWLGLNAGDRVRKLALCNTAAKIGNADTWNARIDIVTREGLQPIIPTALERWFTPPFHIKNPDVIARTRKMLEDVNPTGYAAACAAVRDMDVREKVHRIGVPTLIISGTHDPVTPPADGRYMADKIKGAQYVELNAAHLSNIEAAPEFTSNLLKFFEE